MTDRITRRKTPMLEYGRKPYLVTKETVPEGENADYRYMMDTTWHKAQDNKYIVVQSVMKKPYRQQDYQMMENEGDGYTVMYPKYDFPLPVLEPVNTGSESYSGLKWIQCATPVSASKIYTIIVQNSSKTASTIVNGRTRKSKTIYSPTTFQLAKYTPSAKGFSLSNIINKGATTWVTLTTSSDAEGTYSIHATDGTNTISKLVSLFDKELTIAIRKGAAPYTYYKLRNLIGGEETPYTIFTQQGAFLTPDHGSYYLNHTVDYIDSYTVKYSNLYTLVWDDDTTITTVAATTTYDYDITSNVSFTTDDGVSPVGGSPPLHYSVYQTFDEETYDLYYVANEYTRYYKYSGGSISVIVTDYSTNEIGGVQSNCGTVLMGRYFVDKNSNVTVGYNYDNSIPYVMSGMFSNGAYVVSTSWAPTITIGLL